MKVTGIIAEYNPFHNGHQFHIQKARELTGADYIVVIMSGDYTQRGTPAIFNKYVRAKAALLSGADLILEMPVYGSVVSAQDFASCGVNSLSATGICDCLFFGSEAGDIELLKKQAEFMSGESEEVSALIKEGLKSGLSWPAALAKAHGTNVSTANAAAENASVEKANVVQELVATTPNDILGIEYIKAINKLHSDMQPVTIKRTDPGYHSEERSGSFASATAARKAILEANYDFAHEVLPDSLFECLAEESCPPITFDDFSLLLGERLLNMPLETMMNVSGMPEDLARKFYKNRMEFLKASELVAARKDRQYTYTRVNRCLLNLMLGITKDDMETFKSYDMVPWLRILGFRKDAGALLSELKKNASAPIITKTANASSILSEPDRFALFEKHLNTSELYRLSCQLRNGRSMKNEYTRSIIIV